MSAADTIVYGWAIVSTHQGQPYFNTEGAYVPERVMLKAAMDVILGDRRAEVMHDGRRAGTVIYAFPLTADIAAAMGITTTQTGLLVGIQYDDPAILHRIERGELVGLSPKFLSRVIPYDGA